MNLTTQQIGDAILVTINEDRIDAAAAINFKDSIVSQARGGPPRVVLDLAQVQFVDSSGLGAIVAVMKLLSPDQKLDLAGLAPIVAKVFKLTRMDSVFAIFPTAEDATTYNVH
jgi:anti-sigma B factor antagonist